MDPASNVFGEPLEPCSDDPMTGFFRDGCCNTSDEDFGRHTVCTRVTREFLDFSRSRGNDLSTPREEFGFPGLLPGDQWCLCAARWQEALEAGAAPRVVLRATHAATLEIVAFGTSDATPSICRSRPLAVRFEAGPGRLLRRRMVVAGP